MHTLSAIELRDAFIKGDYSCVQIATHFLHHTRSIDSKTGAFLTLFEERMMERARQLDQKRAKKERLGKLAGVPIAVKDNINIRKERTTCASNFLKNYYAPFDATVIHLLEQEDALLMGKTNLDEFAMGSSTEHSALQATRNPWNLQCSPGGSSGGSAVAVAARMSLMSLGSDTGGSIRQPASLCGILAFKPTFGRVSRYGLVAFGSSLDQIGPFATQAKDIGLIMEVMGQHDHYDATSLNFPAEAYLSQMKEGYLKGKRIGVPRAFLEGLHPEVDKNYHDSLAILQGLGAQLVDVSLETLKYSIAIYYILATAEASTNLARFDGVRFGMRSKKAKTLSEVYDYSKGEGFGAEVKRRIFLGTYVLSAGYQDAFYFQAQKVRTLMIQEHLRAFEKVDFIATPVSPFPAFEIGSIHDPVQEYLADIFTIPANLTGIPAISVPSGFTQDNKPLGLQLCGPQRADVSVVAAAYAFEAATGFNKKIPDIARVAS